MLIPQSNFLIDLNWFAEFQKQFLKISLRKLSLILKFILQLLKINNPYLTKFSVVAAECNELLTDWTTTVRLPLTRLSVTNYPLHLMTRG